MKYKVHVPTEQYGFCEAEWDATPLMNPETMYSQIADYFKPKTGLPDKDFQAFIIRQLLGGDGNHVEEFNAMNQLQQKVVQENKKALQTIKRRNEN